MQKPAFKILKMRSLRINGEEHCRSPRMEMRDRMVPGVAVCTLHQKQLYIQVIIVSSLTL